MTQTARNISGMAAKGRRGSIYAVVLAMAILVSLIGLSAVAVGRINLRTALAGGDAASAELLALSAIEHAVAVVNDDSNWRSNFVHDQTAPPRELGTGQFTWKLLDEFDQDLRLTVGGIQPARVVGIGSVGEARRAFSVVLVPSGPNQLTNAGIEAGVSPFEVESGNCVLEAVSTEPHQGVRALRVTSRVDRLAGPQQDVTTKVSDGKWYYAEAWIRMSSAAEKPTVCLVVRGSGGLLGLSNWEESYRASSANPVGFEWTKLRVTLNPNWGGGSVNRIYWRIETSATNQEFYVDDVKLIEAASPTPMAPSRDTWRQESLN